MAEQLPVCLDCPFNRTEIRVKNVGSEVVSLTTMISGFEPLMDDCSGSVLEDEGTQTIADNGVSYDWQARTCPKYLGEQYVVVTANDVSYLAEKKKD